MASSCNFLKAELDISTKLSNLEERASKLELEFSGIMSAATELSVVVKRYVDKMETEARSWEIMASIIEGDKSARDVLDHVKIFFNFLLAKMATKRAEITDLKMLWHLVESEGVKQVFIDVIRSFGFKDEDADDIKLLLAVTYKMHVDLEREVEKDQTDTRDSENEINDMKSSANETLGQSAELESDLDVTKQYDKCAEQNTTMDYTSVPNDLNDELSKNVLSWNVEDSVKNVANRMIAIVVYTLNVGRAEKDLSIVSK